MDKKVFLYIKLNVGKLLPDCIENATGMRVFDKQKFCRKVTEVWSDKEQESVKSEVSLSSCLIAVNVFHTLLKHPEQLRL